MAKIEVSNGELFDKLSILEIKQINIKDEAKLVNVNAELKALVPEFYKIVDALDDNHDVMAMFYKLWRINLDLWRIEDELREMERAGIPIESDFIYKARLVYKTNDKRAIVKREINEVTGSSLVEEKSYEEY